MSIKCLKNIYGVSFEKKKEGTFPAPQKEGTFLGRQSSRRVLFKEGTFHCTKSYTLTIRQEILLVLLVWIYLETMSKSDVKASESLTMSTLYLPYTTDAL